MHSVEPIVRRSILVCALAIGGILVINSGSAHAKPRGFSSAEQSDLAKGLLVTRRVAKRHGSLRLVGGSSWQVVNAPPEIVWNVVSDVSAYPKYIPNAKSARTISKKGHTRVVRIRHAGGPFSVEYHLRMTPDDKRKELGFKLDPNRPNGVRAAWGFLNVRPYKGGKTMLSYGIMADIGDWAFVGLVRPAIHKALLKLPRDIKRFIYKERREKPKSYRARYGSGARLSVLVNRGRKRAV